MMLMPQRKPDTIDSEIDAILKKPAQRSAPPSSVFETSFGELQGGFRNQFGRDFEITGGANTPLHQKLHAGKGRDVRVKDLTPEQGDWLIKRGMEMGFDVRDFREEWEKYGGTAPHIHFDVGGHDDIDQELNRILATPADDIDSEIDSILAAPATPVQVNPYAQPDPSLPPADWSPDRAPTNENTKRMVNQLLTNQHLPKQTLAQDAATDDLTALNTTSKSGETQQVGLVETIKQVTGVDDETAKAFLQSPQGKKYLPASKPTVNNIPAQQNVTVTGLNVKNLSPELLKQKVLEEIGFTPADAKNEPFEFRIPMEQIARSIQPGGYLDVQIPDEEYEYLSERARQSKLRAAPLPNADHEQIGGYAFVDPMGGTVTQSSNQTFAQNPNQFLAPAPAVGQGGLIQSEALNRGVAERNASRSPDENVFASAGRDLVAATPGLADLATRPFQYLSTFISGLQRRAGAGIGSPFSEDSAKALDEYGLRDIFDAAAERFYTGKIRPGYEQPVAELSRLAVENFGGDPESALPKFIAHTLELGTDPVSIAAMKPGATSSAGLEIFDNSKDILSRIGQSVKRLEMPGVPNVLKVPTENPQAGFLLFSSDKGKVSKPLEILGAFRKAGLLTGVKTQARNIGGNTMMQGLEEVSRMPASIVDLGVSAVTGERTVQGASLSAMAKASREAATKGVKEFKEIMRNGATHEQLTAQGLPNEIISGSPLLDTYINGSFRFQTAQDAVFKRFAISRSMEEQANLLARSEAKGGLIPKNRISSRADEIVQGVGVSPADYSAMQAQAVEDAAFSTFTNDNKFAQWLDDGIDRLPVGSARHFVADQAIPFRRTPLNIVNRILDYSPVGVAKGITNLSKSLIQKTFDSSEQRAFALAMGRATTGTATIILGYKLAGQGLASGVTEEGDFDKRMWNDTIGRKEGALKIGNKWVEVSRYSPLGNLLALGASIYERSQEERPGADGEFSKEGISAGNIWKSAGQIAEEQPLTRTAGSVKDLFSNPQKFGRDTLGSFVPSISADIAGQLDSKEREAKRWFEGIQKRIPGFRNQLPAKADALGRDIPSSANLNPFSMSSERMTRGLEELDRHRMMLDLPPPQKGEDKAAYQQRVKKLGDARSARLNAVVETKAYQEGNDWFQRAALDEAKRTAGEDLGKGRTVRRGDEHLILHNAKVAVERNKFLKAQQKESFYQKYSSAQRKEFDEAIKEAFGHARARHAKDVSIGEALDQARDELSDLLSDKGDLINNARERASQIR
jgi:hypothetical protein